MSQKATPNIRSDGHGRISILAVATTERTAELERIVSHTRWQMQVVHTVQDALQAFGSSSISVVLCEHRLPDGTWLDVLHATERMSPRPEMIVISPFADHALWDEVLNCGGYDLLATPLEPRVIYEIVPMAWRQSKGNPEKVLVSTAQPNGKRQVANA